MSQKLRVMAYIDGYNLYHGIKHAARSGEWPSRYYWLDIASLIQNRLHSGQELVSCKYYTGIRPLPKKIKVSLQERATRQESLDRQRTYLAALRAQPLTSVYEHPFIEKDPLVCDRCCRTRMRYEEKQTDVHIGVDLVADAALNLFDLAWLVTADTDFVPAIRRVRTEWPDKEVGVMIPPGQLTAQALVNESTRKLTIKRKHLQLNQLPRRVETGDGRSVERPAEWSEE
ncbi:MAG: uncharacterized LabA/DUF88 family protein [Phycisphaerales bacterium]|jgi:uncharacterized LabA/DUF88 family protein